MRRAVGTAAVAGGGTEANASEFLTFRLGDEEYGIEILKVQEIRGYEAVTSIANAPAFVKGIVNLRGTIVPIIDLRIRLGLQKVEYNQFTVVIILNVASHVVGLVVDAVSDVTILRADQIRPAPDLGMALNTAYITGLGTIDQRMIILVDIEKFMTSDDMALIERAVEQQ